MIKLSPARIVDFRCIKRNSRTLNTGYHRVRSIGAYSSAMESAGTATEANNIYMDTTKVKVGELKAAFQELSSDFIGSDFTKGAVDALKGIVEAIDAIVNSIGCKCTIVGTVI